MVFQRSLKKKYTETKHLQITLYPEGEGMNKRLKEGLIGGTLLGIVCVVGAYFRSGTSVSPTFVFSLWYNRVIIGLAVGAPWQETGRLKALLRGAILGLVVSFAFYSTSGFQDPVSFAAGIVYGAMIEGWFIFSEK